MFYTIFMQNYIFYAIHFSTIHIRRFVSAFRLILSREGTGMHTSVCAGNAARAFLLLWRAKSRHGHAE